MVLEGGQGGIGSALAPIVVDLADGALFDARARGDIFITELSGDMAVGTVYSQKGVTLSAPGAILDAGHDTALNIGDVTLHRDKVRIHPPVTTRSIGNLQLDKFAIGTEHERGPVLACGAGAFDALVVNQLPTMTSRWAPPPALLQPPPCASTLAATALAACSPRPPPRRRARPGPRSS